MFITFSWDKPRFECYFLSFRPCGQFSSAKSALSVPFQIMKYNNRKLPPFTAPPLHIFIIFAYQAYHRLTIADLWVKLTSNSGVKRSHSKQLIKDLSIFNWFFSSLGLLESQVKSPANSPRNDPFSSVDLSTLDIWTSQTTLHTAFPGIETWWKVFSPKPRGCFHFSKTLCRSHAFCPTLTSERFCSRKIEIR